MPPVTPGLMSALRVTLSRGARAATASHAALTTAITSSQSPSIVVNIASVRFGSPLSRTTRTASATYSPTASPTPSGVTGVRQLNGVTRSWLLLPARAEAAVEGDVEGVEGCLPPVGPPLAALPGRVEAHEGQVEALEGGLLGGEVAAGVHRAAQPGVDRLDRVGRADHCPDLAVEGQERHEFGPGVLPQPDDRRVAFLPLAAELGEPVERVRFGRRVVDGLEVFRELCPVTL